MSSACRRVGAELHQVRYGCLEVCGTTCRDHLEQLIANTRAPVERIPGRVPVPGIADDAHDRQFARIVGKFGDRIVVADDMMIVYAVTDDLVDGLPTSLVHVHEDKAICNDHKLTRTPVTAAVRVRRN